MQPTAGVVIPGTGGFRKVRMKLAGRGKSGSARAIYLLLPELPCIVFFLLYTKGEADTISSAGKVFLRKAALETKTHQHLIP